VALGPSPSWTSAWGECERERLCGVRRGAELSILYMLELHMHTKDRIVLSRNISVPGCWNETMNEQVRSS
jgi:hypothetical protein